MFKSKKGFTLLELVVVISIIAILALIAVPVAIPQIERSRYSRTQADLESIIKAVDLYHIENNRLPEDIYALKEHVTKIPTTNPYGGKYELGQKTINPEILYLKIEDLPSNRMVQIMNKLPNSALIEGQYHYILRGGFSGWSLQDFVDKGYKAISTMEELQSMTKDGRYVLSSNIWLDNLFVPLEGFTGVLVGRGHTIDASGFELFKSVEGVLVDIVLEGVNTESLRKISDSTLVDETPLLKNNYIAKVAGGGIHSLALTRDGNVYAWGGNTDGQLGLGNTENVNSPTIISSLVETNIVQISTGSHHSLAITEDGNVYSWGSSGNGRLGRGGITNIPQRITALENKRIIQVAGGGSHSLALTEDGNVYAWGLNSGGQLGIGNFISTQTPTRITAFNNLNIVQIEAGGEYSLALTDCGKAYSWGHGWGGRLGHGNTLNMSTPQLISSLANEKIVQVSGSAWHSLALTEGGDVYSWGWNNDGQLGHGDTTQRNSPTLISSLKNIKVKRIASWGPNSSALIENGDLYTWGGNSSGQLGIGDANRRLSPSYVLGLSNVEVVQNSFGSSHALALTKCGDVYSWGGNGDGRLGLGDTTNRLTPTIITYFQSKNQ